MCVCECCVYSTKVLVTQPCPTVCDWMDCSLPGSSVHGILQARPVKWVAIPFSRGFSQPRDWTPHLLQLLYWQVDSLQSEPPYIYIHTHIYIYKISCIYILCTLHIENYMYINIYTNINMHLKSIVLGKNTYIQSLWRYNIYTSIVKYICNIKVHM